MKHLSTLLFVIFFLNCHSSENTIDENQIDPQNSTEEATNPKENNTYKVIGVKDGDTLLVLMDGKETSFWKESQTICFGQMFWKEHPYSA